MAIDWSLVPDHATVENLAAMKELDARGDEGMCEYPIPDVDAIAATYAFLLPDSFTITLSCMASNRGTDCQCWGGKE